MPLSNEWDSKWGVPEVSPSGQEIIDASGKPIEYFLDLIVSGDYGVFGKFDPAITAPAMTDEEIGKMLIDALSESSAQRLLASTKAYRQNQVEQNKCHLNRMAGRRFIAAFPVGNVLLYFSINESGRTFVCDYADSD